MTPGLALFVLLYGTPVPAPEPLTPGERTFLRHYCTPRDDWGAICRRLLERDEASRKERR